LQASVESYPIKIMATTSDSQFRLIYNQRQGTAQFFNEPLSDSLAIKMMLIPAGTFVMGSPEDEPDRTKYEEPQHGVRVPAFCMGKYPVTQTQWKFVAGLPQAKRELKLNPSNFKGGKRPVEQVSWYDAVEFCLRLSAYTGRQYRLPSEAEWEYACRASPIAIPGIFRPGDTVGDGRVDPFHFGETITTDLANYDGSSAYGRGPKGKYRGHTTDVDTFPPNAFGLCDMHGNVIEWCQDHWHESYEGAPTDGSAWLSENENAIRVLRSTSWSYGPRNCRSAYRDINDPNEANDDIGFRVVCNAPKTSV
jgi:formylglycine-generating enzyme required for sulfatase activity